MRTLFRHFIRSLIDWVFRRRSPALFIMRAGLVCTAFGFGSGWVLNVSIPFGDGQVDVSFDSASSTPILLVYAVCVVGLFLIFFGLGREVVRYKAERQRLDRKKIVVVEARGLRDVGGSSLLAAIPASMEGHREHVLVDMRQGIKDGEIEA